MKDDFIMVLVDKGDRERIEQEASINQKTLTEFCEEIILNKIGERNP